MCWERSSIGNDRERRAGSISCPEMARDEGRTKSLGVMLGPILGLRRAKGEYRFGLVGAAFEESLKTVSFQGGLLFCDFVTVHNQFLVMCEP